MSDRDYMLDVIFNTANSASLRLHDGSAARSELLAVLAIVLHGLRFTRSENAEHLRRDVEFQLGVLASMIPDYTQALETLQRRGEGMPTPTVVRIKSPTDT